MFIRILGKRAFSTSIRGIGKHDQDVGALQNLMRMVNDIEAYMNPLATADFQVHVRLLMSPIIFPMLTTDDALNLVDTAMQSLLHA